MEWWICNDCKEQFTEPIYLPEYVDDSRIAAFYSPACPYCHSDEVDIVHDFGGDEEDDD